MMNWTECEKIKFGITELHTQKKEEIQNVLLFFDENTNLAPVVT
jgi:hypothetical protein